LIVGHSEGSPWIIRSLGAFDMGPGLHYYKLLILEMLVVVVSLTLDSYSTHLPQFWICYTLSLSPKSVPPKAAK
jgi:hypothetical protein